MGKTEETPAKAEEQTGPAFLASREKGLTVSGGAPLDLGGQN